MVLYLTHADYRSTLYATLTPLVNSKLAQDRMIILHAHAQVESKEVGESPESMCEIKFFLSCPIVLLIAGKESLGIKEKREYP